MAEHTGDQASDSSPEDISFDTAALLHTLRENRGIIVKASVGSCALALAVSFLIPAKYTSQASFIPPALSSNASMASMIAGQISSLGGGELLGGTKNSGDLYAGILRSRSIISELVKRFSLMQVYRVKKESQAEKELDSDTVVNVDLKSSIVTVNVSAESPALAHDLASAYMDVLRATNGRLALGQTAQRRLFFEQQLEKEKDNLADAEVELKKTEEQSGLIAPTGQTDAEIRTIAETQAQIALREVQLASLRDSATEENPEVIRLRSEINDLQGQLAGLQRGNGSRSTAAIPTSNVPEVQLEYVRKEREVKYHEALFDMLSRQYEAARLDEARDAPVLQVLDSASYPDAKSSPNRISILLVGFLIGLIGSSTWVLLREYLQAKVAAASQSQAD